MTGPDRYRELDAARGIAILMMILYHTLFDLNFFSIMTINVSTGFWRYFAFATASLFLLIVGVSLSISHARFLDKSPPGSGFMVWKKFLQRGAVVAGFGLLVTVATFLYLHEGFVVFGILHVIGISILLSPLFFRYREKNILIGIVVILIGVAIPLAGISGPALLLPLGIHPSSFWSVDYEPVFPWTGLVLIGIGLGNLLYPDGRRAFSVPDLPRLTINPLPFLGRYSLVIYLIHQPVILLVLQVVSGHRILW